VAAPAAGAGAAAGVRAVRVAHAMASPAARHAIAVALLVING
jgi:hypothetical protein